MSVIGAFGEKANLFIDWSNFEIADMDFWRGEAYQAFFEYLESTGGFYYEVSFLRKHVTVTLTVFSGGEMPPFIVSPLPFSLRKTKYISLKTLDIDMKGSSIAQIQKAGGKVAVAVTLLTLSVRSIGALELPRLFCSQEIASR